MVKRRDKIFILPEKSKEEKKPLKLEVQDELFHYEKNSIDWHKYNLAKTKQKIMFYRLLYELCSLIPKSPQHMGRPRAQIRDLIFSMGLKLYTNCSGRVLMSDLEHAKALGYIERVHHYNTLSDFMNQEELYELLQKLLEISARPLSCLEDEYSLDASGFGSYQYERWQVAKHKNKRGWRNYLKGHISVGTRTNVVCSAEVTCGNFSDVRQAPKLLEPLKCHNPKEISADKAYSAKSVFKIIESLGAMPLVPFKSNANPGEDAPEIWLRMFRYFTNHREEFNKRYHRRSNVETTFSMIKRNFGEFLRYQNYTSQRNELMVKFICHNICCLNMQIFNHSLDVDFKKHILNVAERNLLEQR